MTDHRPHDEDPRPATRRPLRLPRRLRPLAAWLLVVLLASWYVTWWNRPATTGLGVRGPGAGEPVATEPAAGEPATTAPGRAARPAAADPGPWVVAHRGGALQAPENTLAAIRMALAQDVHGIEIDVHLAADGVVVLMHDATVDRTTDGTGPVSDHTAAELAALDAGGWFGAEFSGEPVPTLAQVLGLVAGQVELCIEVKGGEEQQPGITAAVVAEVVARRAASWCWIGSFHDSVLEEAVALSTEQAPDLRLVKIAVGQVTGLPLAVDHGPRPGWLPFGQPVTAVSVNHRLLTGPEADRLHRQDLQVWAWTVNQADDIARALERGADAVVTDTPPLAHEVIATRRAR